MSGIQRAGLAPERTADSSASGGNPSTTISDQLSGDSRVRMKIFDPLGREVATLLGEERPAGYYQVGWELPGVSSGVYVYELASADVHGSQQVGHRTIVLVKQVLLFLTVLPLRLGNPRHVSFLGKISLTFRHGLGKLIAHQEF